MGLGASAIAAYESSHASSQWYCENLKCDGKPHKGFPYNHCRMAQRPPEGDWLVWMLMTGRGFGKTRAGAEYVLDQVNKEAVKNIALVGRTPRDYKDVMVQTILNCSPTDQPLPKWEPTKQVIVFSNGIKARAYSGEAKDGVQLRGKEHDLAWVDELSTFVDAKRGDKVDTSWNNLMLTMRLKGSKPPKILVSTTPKRVRLIRELLARPSTVVTRGTTYENMDNLGEGYDNIIEQWQGTTTGKQELEGLLLEDSEGALFSREKIENTEKRGSTPELTRIVVGVDPAMTSGDDADETGIIVVGKGPHDEETCNLPRCKGHAYVLADSSIIGSPDQWAKRVAQAYDTYSANTVIAEGNQGGEMVEEVLKTACPGMPVKRVFAKTGKRARAEPIAALMEQGRIHHVGSLVNLEKLEDEMVSWEVDSGESPDHLDAYVWAIDALGLTGSNSDAFIEAWAKEAEGNSIAKPLSDKPKPSAFAIGDPGGVVKPKKGCKHRWQERPIGNVCIFCSGHQEQAVT